MLRAFDGATALEMFDREQPDLVMVDLFLPDISGYEVLCRVRRQSAVPMIAITGLADDEEIARALDLGADALVAKPFHSLVFLARVKAMLRRCESGPGCGAYRAR